MKQREAQERQKKFDLLPENFQHVVREAGEEYEKIGSLINVGNALVELVDSLTVGIQHCENSDRALNADAVLLLKALEKFKTSLESGAFSQFLNDGSAAGEGLPISPFSLENLLFKGPEIFDEIEQAKPYKEQDLENLIKKSEVLGTYPLPGKLGHELGLFIDILRLTKEKNLDDLIQKVLIFIYPKIEQGKESIQEKIDFLEQSFAQDSSFLDNDDNDSTLIHSIIEKKSVIQAIRYWHTEVKKYLRTIKIFEDIKRSANQKFLNNTSFLFKSFAYGYEYLWKMVFYDKYKYDLWKIGRDEREDDKSYARQFLDSVGATHFVLADGVDSVWRTGMSLWYFFNARADHRQATLLQISTGKTPLKGISSTQLLMQMAMAAGPTIMTFFDPCWQFWKMSNIKEAYADVLATYVYYHLFHLKLFEGKKGFEVLGGDVNGGFMHWPNNYYYMKIALRYAISRTSSMISLWLKYKIRDNVDPHVLDKVKHYSWGVIRPEMVRYIIDTCVRSCYASKSFPKWIANFEKKDAYGNRWMMNVTRNLFDWDGLAPESREYNSLNDFTYHVRRKLNKGHGISKETIDQALREKSELTAVRGRERIKELEEKRAELSEEDFDAKIKSIYDDIEDAQNLGALIQKRYHTAENFSVDCFYIEQCIMSYVFGSVGEYWGRILSKRYSKQIHAGVASVTNFFVKTLSAFGILSKDAVEEWEHTKQDIAIDIEKAIRLLKGMAHDVLSPFSGNRVMVVNYLKGKGYIDEDLVDHNEINKSIFEFAINSMFKWEILTASDAIMLLREVRKDTDYDKLLDKIVEMIRENLISIVGGKVGEITMSGISQVISQKWGPFYKKIPSYS